MASDGIDVLMAAASAAQQRRKDLTEESGQVADRMIGVMQKNRQLGLLDRQTSVEEQTLPLKARGVAVEEQLAGLKGQELEIEKLKAKQMNDLLGSFLSQGAAGAGGASPSGLRPKGFTINGMTFEDPSFAGKKKAIEKGAESEREVDNFVRGMAQIFKSMESASPGNVSAGEARLKGITTPIANAIGAVDPKVTAELDTLKLKARSTLKKFESGRLTDKDVADAVNAITGINRNTPERLAKAVSVSKQIAADRGIDPAVMEEKLSKALGVSVEDMNLIIEGKKQFSSKKQFKAGDTKDINGTTYVRGDDGKWRPKS